MSFDTLAPFYREMETILAGNRLQRNRTAFLDSTRKARRALLLGEGPGLFLKQLIVSNPRVDVTCVEKSGRMIEVARSQLSLDQLARVRFENVDVARWNPPKEPFDLVVTNFFLDCFGRSELEQVVLKIARCASVDAVWLVTDFREPERGWRRWRGRIVLALMYGFFRAATEISATRLAPPDEFLLKQGFRLEQRRLDHFDLIHADLWRRCTS